MDFLFKLFLFCLFVYGIYRFWLMVFNFLLPGPKEEDTSSSDDDEMENNIYYSDIDPRNKYYTD